MGRALKKSARIRNGALGLVALFQSVALLAHAATLTFNIAAGSAQKSLDEFVRQSHIQMIYRSDAVGDKTTNAIKGDLEIKDALAQMLAGSGLIYKFVNAGTVSITPAQNAAQIVDPSVTTQGPIKHPINTVRDTNNTTASAPSSESDVGLDAPTNQSLDERKRIPEILVRGSKIMNVDVQRTEDDVQPYTILSSEMIQQSGATNLEDFLKTRLTMNTSAQSYNQAYGLYGGTPGNISSINLRGLGANETLILIDGRRTAGISFSGGSLQPDINSIPLAAIERIEVLPSGASAIYGGAAVGGVVNIILKKNFAGGRVDSYYENTTNASAPLRAFNATYGFSIDATGTQVMLAGHYSDARTLALQDRAAFTERGINTILANSSSYFYNTSLPFSGATPNIASADGSDLILKTGAPLSSPITSIPPGAGAATNLSADLASRAGAYNLNLAAGTGQYGLKNPIGTAPTVKTLMATIRQDFGSYLEGFTQLSTSSNSSRSLLNSFTGSYFVPGTAPENPFQQDVMIDIPTNLTTPITSDSVTRSMTLGLLGHLPANWNAELDYTWSGNAYEYAYDSYDADAFSADLAIGVVNPFVDTIAHPLNLSPYLAPSSFSGRSSLNDVGLRISGPLPSLWAGQPTLTIGLEHRNEGVRNSDYLVSYPLTPVDDLHYRYFSQSQSTNSVYLEAQIPLIAAGNSIPLVHSLEAQLAGRTERYTVFAGTPFTSIPPSPYDPPQGASASIKYTSTNPTIGLKYQPLEGLTFRASFAKAFLPPTATQFLPNPTPCLACDFVTDPVNGQTYNVDAIFGGNPNLKPQTSRSWDLGVIAQPQMEALQGLRLDVEYYRITQPNFITTPSAQQIVDNQFYASRVTRDSTTGLITSVDRSYVNAASYATSGWDLKLNYVKPTGFGTFDFHLTGTIVSRDRRQYSTQDPVLDYAGFPSESGEVKTRATATVSWEFSRWKLGWTSNYWGSYFQGYGSPASPYALQNGPSTFFTDAQGGFSIPSQTYHDLFASYTVERPATGAHGLAQTLLSNFAVQITIKNIFNKSPPFDAYYQPYFYSPYGDPRLRDYRITVSKGF